MDYWEWARRHPVRAWICVAILVFLAWMAIAFATGNTSGTTRLVQVRLLGRRGRERVLAKPCSL